MLVLFELCELNYCVGGFGALRKGRRGRRDCEHTSGRYRYRQAAPFTRIFPESSRHGSSNPAWMNPYCHHPFIAGRVPAGRGLGPFSAPWRILIFRILRGVIFGVIPWDSRRTLKANFRNFSQKALRTEMPRAAEA